MLVCSNAQPFPRQSDTAGAIAGNPDTQVGSIPHFADNLFSYKLFNPTSFHGPPMIKVILAEDHLLVRQGLALLLQTSGDFTVVAETDLGQDVPSLLTQHHPDVLLLDLTLRDGPSLELTRSVRRAHRNLKIMVITGNAFHGAAIQAMAAGADGFLLKHDHGDELLVGIRTVLAGSTYITPSITRGGPWNPYMEAASSGTPDPGLTAREQQIMRLIANGMTNPEVANVLHISVLTARKHRQNLMNKLNLHNSAEITAYAIRSGLLEQPKHSPA